MRILREIAKKLPVIPFVYRALRDRYLRYQLKSKSTEKVFTEIHRSNAWGGKDSVSGPGSDVHQTRIITTELPALLNDLNISTMLDIPCGDFHWMKSVDLNSIDYTGADVVKELIQKNREKYARDGVRFQYLNLIKGKLPKVDLIFCRDCLMHFSFADIFLALNNVCNSQSGYFLTTTFTGRKDNRDIITGQWRVLNLELVPLVLPKPLQIINEGCTEGEGAYEDKALGLWRIADIRESLNDIGVNPDISPRRLASGDHPVQVVVRTNNNPRSGGHLMQTACNQLELEFQELGRRRVVGKFDGGRMISDGEGLRLREVA